MYQLEKQYRDILIRETMPILYRMQERRDRRNAPKGGIYHLNVPDDYDALLALIDKTRERKPLA